MRDLGQEKQSGVMEHYIEEQKEQKEQNEQKEQKEQKAQIGRKRGMLQRYLSREISIDYKACAYSFCIILFYCGYLLIKGVYKADILYLTEIFICTYIISYLQVYVFANFDEADRIGVRETIGIVASTLLYALASYFGGWFDKSIQTTLWFVVYLVVIFLSLFTANLIKRRIDTNNLNEMLQDFKERRD